MLLSLVIAYGGGLWIHWQHDLAGGHEAVPIPPVLHWLRDSSLALPLIILAVWLGRKAASFITFRTGWDKTGLPNILLETALMTLFASAFVTAGIPVHGYWFGASLEHEMSLVEHMLHDGIQVLLVNVLIIGLFNLLWLGTENRSENRYQKIKYALSGTLLTSAIIAALFLSPLSAVFGLSGLSAPSSQPAAMAPCERTITADVVALDQPFYYNRLGAIQANGMMYALARDVVVAAPGNPLDGQAISALTNAQRGAFAGQVSLRIDKRPRPIVLRMNEGDCLSINFTNLLDPVEFLFVLPGDFPTGPINLPNGPIGVTIPQQVADQPLTREASIHIDGLSLFGDIGSDGSNVGQNTPGSLVAPGASTTYQYHADHEATHLMYSMGATMGADGAGGARTYGLFGAVGYTC